MRYWLLSLAVALSVAGICMVQTPTASSQVKDPKKKDPFKDKDKKDKIDPKDMPSSPDFKEPEEVHGKNFEYWHKKIHSDDPTEREMAMKTILLFGANKAYEAVPTIIQEIKSHGGNPNVDLSVRVNGIQALHTIFRYKKNPDQKFINDTFAICKKNLKDPQVILRMQTMKGMPTLGPKSREAIDDIVLITKDPVSWEMRKEAIPVLVALTGPDVAGGTPDPRGLAALRDRCNPDKEKSALVRQTALQGVAMLGQALPPELVRGLDDPSAAVRLTALNCIAAMSHTPRMDDQSKKSAEKRIEEFLSRDPDKALNMWGHAAIITLQKKVTADHIKPIVKRIYDKDTSLRLLALQIIGVLGPEGKKYALDDVKDAIRDPEVPVGVAAIHAGMSMHAFAELKPFLVLIYEDKKANETLHYAASEALDLIVAHEKMEREKQDNNKDKKGEKK